MDQTTSVYDFRTICSLVADKEKDIQVEGKDLIILFSVSQNGKSTLINSYRGQQYKVSGNVLIELNDIPDKAETGTAGGGSKTLFPKSYLHPKNPSLAFLDTRGYFDSYKKDISINEIIAGTILLEMAIKNANSVRIIGYEDFNELAKGLTSCCRFCEQLQKIFICNKSEKYVPVLYVFNRFKTEDPDIQFQYLNPQTPPEEKYRIASEQVKLAADDMIKKSFEPGQSTQHIHNFIANRKDEHIAAVNPCDQYSVMKTLELALKLPPVDLDYLVLKKYHPLREQFDKEFSISILYSLPQIQKQLFMMKYPNSFFQNLLQQFDEQLHQCLQHQEILQNSNHTEENTELGQMYQLHMDETLEELKRKKESLEQKLDRLSLEIKSFDEIDPNPIFDESWDENGWLGGFIFSGKKTINYTKGIPYVKEATKEEYNRVSTERKSIHEDNIHFHVKYSAVKKHLKDVADAFQSEDSITLGVISAALTLLESNRCVGSVRLYSLKKDEKENQPTLKAKQIEYQDITNELKAIEIMRENLFKGQIDFQIKSRIEHLEKYKAILIENIDIYHQWPQKIIDLENLKGMNEIIIKLQLNTSNSNDFKDLYAQLQVTTPITLLSDITSHVMEIRDEIKVITDLEQKIIEQDLSEPEPENKSLLIQKAKKILGL